MFTGFNTVDCQQMTSVKRPSLASPTKRTRIVWLPFSIADAAKRRTFNINNFNRRTMVQGAGLVMPDWLKSKTEERSREAEGALELSALRKNNWQYSPYDFEGCSDYNCEGWRE